MLTRRLLVQSGLALATVPALAKTAGAQASKLDFAFVGHEL
jgi:ABC-type Fe2+-enterobactin transport system substrate-binding protein